MMMKILKKKKYEKSRESESAKKVFFSREMLIKNTKNNLQNLTKTQVVTNNLI